MSSFLSRIKGVALNFFQIGGPSGPGFKNTSGVLEARDAADANYVRVNAKSSVATVGALPTAPPGTIIEVDATHALYVRTTVGTWTPYSLAVPATAFGADPSGVADSSAAIQSAVTALAGTGIGLFLPAGTYLISVPISVPNNITIQGAGRALTVIKSTIVPTGIGPGDYLQSVFIALPVQGAATALSTQTTIGSKTVQTVGAVAVGSRVTVGNGNLWQQAAVVGTAGGGPFTLTLDQEIEYVFAAAGNFVTIVSPPTDITILDMTISGTGDRAIELATAYQSEIRRVDVTNQYGTFNAIIMSFDTGSLRCGYKECTVYAGGGSAAGIAVEVGNRCWVEDCFVEAVGSSGSNSGYYFPAGRNIRAVNASSDRCYYGLLMSPVGAGTDSCQKMAIVGGSHDNANQAGVFIQSATADIHLLGVTARFNGTHGCVVTGSGAAIADRVTLDGCSFYSNTDSGFWTDSGTTTISSLATGSNTIAGITQAGTADITVSGWESNADVSGFLRWNGTGKIRIANITATAPSPGAWTVSGIRTSGGSGSIRVVNGTFTLPNATGALLDFTAGTMSVYFENVRMTGGNYGVYLNHGNAAVFIRGTNVDLSSAAIAPYTLGVAATTNFGTFTLNGVTQVDVTGGVGSFPVGTPIVFSLKTVGGTPGNAAPYFSTTPIADHFYVKSPTAGANDIYNWIALV